MEKKNDLEKKLFTRNDLAQRWNCSTATIFRLERNGKLKAMGFGKRFIRYKNEEVERLEREMNLNKNRLERSHA
jgi:predicted site-specific integrase-resolvase